MLPQIQTTQDTLSIIDKFLGVNKNYAISESEFSDAMNITNDQYPVLSNRKQRGIISVLTNPNGMIGGRYLSNVCGNILYYNQQPVLELSDLNCERQLVMMGANLVVFPDGIIYNTYTEEVSTIENETKVSNAVFTLSDISGNKFTSDNTVVGNTEPGDKTKYWLDTSTDTVVFKQYSASSSKWVSVPSSYVKIEATNIGKGFKAYDAVRFEDVDTNESSTWTYNNFDFNAQSMIVYAVDDDYLIVSALINMTHTNSKKITIRRNCPKMDFVCEQDNRIWGCSTDNHEIYACKQGDPTNWEFYGGLDSDSYAATVGTQNVFTGAISYRGYVYFFKEDGYHKIFGSKPSNYEITWNSGRGLQEGSAKSLIVAGDYLMYKAVDGVCIFDGSGSIVSNALGKTSYYGAVAGSYRDKYYVSMRDKNYKYKLYVYDITKSTWTIEDDIECKYMATCNSGLYIVDYDNVLYCVTDEAVYSTQFLRRDLYPERTVYLGNLMNQSEFITPTYPTVNLTYPSDDDTFPVDNSNSIEGQVEWMFESGDLGVDNPYQKYIKRLIIRVWLDTSSKMKIEINYDSSDEWINLIDYYATLKRSYEIPLVIKRCDHFRLRFSGFGDFRLYSIAKAIEEGSSR